MGIGPLPWIFPGAWFVRKLFQIVQKRDGCVFDRPARLSKYSAPVSDAFCTADLAVILPIDFHTSNIQRAQMKRLAPHIVRSGNPISRPPEGRSDDGRCNDNTHSVTNCFIRRDSAISRPAVFSSISFLPRQKRYGPRSGGRCAANRTAPSAHSKCTAGGIPHRLAQKITYRRRSVQRYDL